jgi:hypothetical protein
VITDVLPGAFTVLGAGDDDRLGLRERLGPARRIAVLLVDGLGYHLLPRAAQSSPFLADVVAGRIGRLDEIASMLPSTTPTSLVSMGTGAGPGEHGILGFTLNVPGTDRVLTHVLWRDDPPPNEWQPVPTVFARAGAAGVSSSVVLPVQFGGSGLTVSAYGGAQFVGRGRGEDLVTAMLHAFDAGSALVYGYTPNVDTAAHSHGIASPQWAQAAHAAGHLIERLLAALDRDTALVVIADHGGLDVPWTSRVDVGTDPRLAAGLRVIAGEPRFRHLHTVPGATADVIATWSGILDRRAEVMAREDAVSRELFGPVRPAHLPRIGDVVVVAEDDTAVLASGYEPASVATLVGFHGGRTSVETAIPLLSFAADAQP